MRGAEVSPRDVVAAVLPDPATLGERMTGRTCAGTWVTGHRHGRRSPARPTSTTWSTTSTTMREYGSQAVVWQTAINPVVALELLDRGEWKGTGVLGPEAFPPQPFLELLGRDRLTARAAWSCRLLAPARRSEVDLAAARSPSGGGLLEQAGRRRFGLAREELAEVGARDEHDDARRGSCRRCPSTAAA